GSYRYLYEIYGPKKFGKLVSFLFIWQLSFSAPLSIASGSLGLAHYAAFFWPHLEQTYAAHDTSLTIPLLGELQMRWLVSDGTFVAILACLLVMFLLFRRITSIGTISKSMWVVVMGTIAWIIFAGLTHFNSGLAFSFPPNAFHLSEQF